MLIEVVLSLGELRELVRQLAPIRIHMAPAGEATRWVDLRNPHNLYLVPGKGLHVEASGQVKYDVAGISFAAEISSVQLLIEPRIEQRPVQSEDRSPVLLFSINIQGGGLRGVPSLIDQSIISRVNKALTPDATKMLWEFPETLTQSFSLPERLQPLDAFLIEAGCGEVAVTKEDVTFSVNLDANLTRDEPDEPNSL